MQITEFFTSTLEASLNEFSKGNLVDFLPDFHTSLPQLQENFLYLCASGKRTIKQSDLFAFQNVESYLFLFTESGQGLLNTDGDSCTLTPGTLLLWDCRDYLQLKALQSSWNIDLLFFDGNAASVYYEEICKLRFPCMKLPADSPVRSNIQQLTQIGPKTSPHHAVLENKLLTDILSDILLGIHIGQIDEKPVPSYIREIKTLFDTHYQENHSIEELASLYHVNRYRLCREFSRYYAQTPLKYLNDVRLMHARKLLESTNLRVHEVGSAVGIDNTTHFINLFKAKTGTTPTAYRDGYLSFREIDL